MVGSLQNFDYTPDNHPLGGYKDKCVGCGSTVYLTGMLDKRIKKNKVYCVDCE